MEEKEDLRGIWRRAGEGRVCSCPHGRGSQSVTAVTAVELGSHKRPRRGLAGLTEGKKELIQWE